MSWKLTVIEGSDRGQIFSLDPVAATLLGRSRHAGSRLNDDKVSPVHCEMEIKGDKVAIADLDSHWGTYVNGKRIREFVLEGGENIRVGDTHLRLDRSSDTINQKMTQELPLQQVQAQLAAARL